MDEIKSVNPTILKILNGAQAGAEVALRDGTYALGSGSDDDIQLIDISLRPGHARLRVAEGRIEIQAQAGPLRTAAGLVLPPNGDWQALEPLDVVTAGTMRFALGPATAQWASIGDEGAAQGGPAASVAEPAAARLFSLATLRVSAGPLLVLLLVCGLAAWVLASPSSRFAIGHRTAETELEQTRAALDRFPFGRSIEAHQEVDGTVYVNGYVETPVERRALANAIEAAGVAPRVRLWVLESLRAEIAALIKGQKVNVSSDLSAQGALTMSGIILDPDAAARFVDTIKDRVFGLRSVESRIRTAPDFLADVRKLLDSSQLQPWLVLRLDRDLVEVSGALPVDKVDAWVGFLQSYAKTFAKDIALRSFVQLQTAGGGLAPAPGGAITIGDAGGAGGTALDLDKLKQGSFSLGDVFVGGADTLPARTSSQATAEARPAARPTGEAAALGANGRLAGGVAGNAAAGGGFSGNAAAGGGASGNAAAGGAGEPGGRQGRKATDGVEASVPGRPAGATTPAPGTADILPTTAASEAAAGRDLLRGARTLIERWRDGTLGSDSEGRAVKEALDTLQRDVSATRAARGGGFPDWYVPAFRAEDAAVAGEPCWPDTRLRAEDLPSALFWLDLLGSGDKRTLATFDTAQQLRLLDVALNPARVTACAQRTAAAKTAAARSSYLHELRRNPDFIRYIVKSLPSSRIDIAGADYGGDRFILTRTGLKIREGAAPDRGSRLVLVGELGVVFQQNSGLSVDIFNPDMTWRIAP